MPTEFCRSFIPLQHSRLTLPDLHAGMGCYLEGLTAGPNACCTGVLFQPSRIAMDSYQLRIFLATRPYKVTLDIAGTMDALVANHPGLLRRRRE